MGLTLPAELTEPLGWIGLTWPEADEELLFEAGQRWVAYGEQLFGIALQADQQAVQVWTSGSGPAVEAFREWWTGEEGPSRRLAEDAVAALLIGAALVAFAALTLALKVAFIAQLIILAVEVGQAIATAFVTFGATTAEVPGFVAATRLICRRLVQQVVQHVTTVIKDIFERAARLLKKVEAKVAAKVEAGAVRRVERGIAKDVARVNPRFNPPHPSYSANCVNCVQAFELRRRGLDVQAGSLPPRFWAQRGRPLADLETAWGRNFTPGSQTDIENVFRQAGPGSRGVVYINWREGGGHVFNVENVRGTVRFVDGQNSLADAGRYFARGGNLHYIRLDDLPPGNVGPFLGT